MEEGLKNRIAIYVEKIGASVASDRAEEFLSVFSGDIDESERTDVVVAKLKFHVAVLEYLHCDSDKVDKYLDLLP